MRCRKSAILILVGILFSALTLSGCSANRVSLADQGLVSVEQQDSEKVKILWTDVYQQDGQTWVYGVLKQRRSGTSSIKTHVDIKVSTKDGSVYYETISEDIYVPRNRVGKGVDWMRFRVHLPEELPEGSQIKMIAHAGKHENL